MEGDLLSADTYVRDANDPKPENTWRIVKEQACMLKDKQIFARPEFFSSDYW